jgi:hypothetical protein
MHTDQLSNSTLDGLEAFAHGCIEGAELAGSVFSDTSKASLASPRSDVARIDGTVAVLGCAAELDADGVGGGDDALRIVPVGARNGTCLIWVVIETHVVDVKGTADHAAGFRGSMGLSIDHVRV